MFVVDLRHVCPNCPLGAFLAPLAAAAASAAAAAAADYLEGLLTRVKCMLGLDAATSFNIVRRLPARPPRPPACLRCPSLHSSGWN